MTLTPSQRGDIRAAAAVCEVQGYAALADRLEALIPDIPSEEETWTAPSESDTHSPSTSLAHS